MIFKFLCDKRSVLILFFISLDGEYIFGGDFALMMHCSTESEDLASGKSAKDSPKDSAIS